MEGHVNKHPLISPLNNASTDGSGTSSEDKAAIQKKLYYGTPKGKEKLGDLETPETLDQEIAVKKTPGEK